MAKFPGKSFGTVSKEVLGPYAGWVVTGMVALSLYVLALARTRSVSLIVISQFMPKTPGWAIAIPMLAVALYGAVTGPDAIGRSAELVFTLLTGILALGAVLLLASKAGPITSLRPILARGIRPVLAASIAPTFLGAVSGSVVLALGRYVKKASSLPKAVMAGILISGLFLLGSTLQVLTTIGHQQAQQSLAPLLAVASSVSIEGIVERTDILLLTAWILGVTFDVTVLLVSSAIVIGDAMSVKYRTVAAALFLIGALPVSHRATDVFSMNLIYSIPVTSTWMLVVFVGAVGAVFVAALIKERKRRGS
jgi:spore germination protein KB